MRSIVCFVVCFVVVYAHHHLLSNDDDVARENKKMKTKMMKMKKKTTTKRVPKTEHQSLQLAGETTGFRFYRRMRRRKKKIEMIVFIYTCVRTYVEYYMFVLIVTLFFCGRIFLSERDGKKSKNLSTSKRERQKSSPSKKDNKSLQFEEGAHTSTRVQ